LADLSVVVVVLTRLMPSAICNRSDCSNSLNVLATFWATHCGHSAAPQPRNQSESGCCIWPSCRPVDVVTAVATAATDATSSTVVACNRFIFCVRSLCLRRPYLNRMHTMIGSDRDRNVNNHRRDEHDLFNLIDIIIQSSRTSIVTTYLIIGSQCTHSDSFPVDVSGSIVYRPVENY